MLTLYTKHSCAFAAMVIHRLDELEVPFEEKNLADPGVADELIARSGNRWTPYLADSETEKEIYGSGPIVKYLDERYGR